MQTSSYVSPFLSGYETRQTALAGSSAVPFDMFSETQRHPRQKSKAVPSRAGKETVAVSGRMMVYEYIRQQMREGSLLPGSVLDLLAISHKLGISNTPLRDSLIRLEAEGYLTIYPRSKVVINTLEAEDFPFLYEIMGALEYTIIAGSIDQYTEATIAKMRRLSGDMREAVMSGDMVTYDRLHYLFHSVFFKFPPISSPSVSSRPSRTACGIFLAKILCANGIWPPWRNTPSSSTLLRNAITNG